MSYFNQNPGKTTEFTQLFEEQINSLFSMALRMTRNQFDAEDLVQDTALRAFRYFDKFDQGSNFRAWILKILTNNFINSYRKKKITPTAVEIESVSFKLEDEDGNYWQELDSQDSGSTYHEIFDDEISFAIDKLPDDYRIVVLLADLEELNYKEIANIIARPIGTVMSRLHRGRKMLQRLLKQYAREKGYRKPGKSSSE